MILILESVELLGDGYGLKLLLDVHGWEVGMAWNVEKHEVGRSCMVDMYGYVWDAAQRSRLKGWSGVHAGGAVPVTLMYTPFNAQ